MNNTASNNDTLLALLARLRQARLNAGLSQEELAERTGVGLRTIRRIDKGTANITLSTLIALLRGLDALEQLDLLLPESDISPVALSKQKSQSRQRASRSRKHGTQPDSESSTWTWGDD